MNAPVKRTKIMTHVKDLNADIMLLQETHLCDSDHRKLNRPWIGQIFHSKFNLKTRGTAILIRSRIDFVPDTIITDSNGRYVIVSGTLYQKTIILASVYAPNWDDDSFMKSFLSSIPIRVNPNPNPNPIHLNSHLLLLGGDMNCVMDPVLDRSNPKPVPLSKMAATLSAFMDRYGYVDPWRLSYPSTRQYSFFLPCAPYILTYRLPYSSQGFIPSISSIQYSPITVSDHSTITLDLHFDHKPKGFKLWHLDPLLLAEVDFCKYLSENMKLFLDTNQNDETSPSLLWETLKAFVRVKIISFTSYANRARKARRVELEKAIADLDNSLSTNQSPDLHKERMVLHTELDLLLTKEAEQNLIRVRGYMYEHGDKASRLLAHQLKAKIASNQITQIKDETSVTSDPETINGT